MARQLERQTSTLSSRAKRGICFFCFLSVTLQGVSASPKDAPTRPRILGIAQIEILASDPQVSVDFYSKTLNLARDTTQIPQEDIFFLAPSQDIRILPAPTPAPKNLIQEITFTTDDVPALRRYLASKNIVGNNPIFHVGQGRDLRLGDIPSAGDYYFTVVDPEGHQIRFLQRRKMPGGSALSSTQPASPSKHSAFRLIHAGFVVRDRAATDHFYKDILGFRPYWHGGMKDDKDDWVAMQVPDGTDWVEYMLNIPTDASKQLLGVMNHIALGVTDIQASKAALLKNGAKLTEEPKLGRDGKWQLNLYDPDLTRVEFMEFTPKEKPCCSEFTGPHPGPKP